MLFHELRVLASYYIFLRRRNGSEFKEAKDTPDSCGYGGQHAVWLLIVRALLLLNIFRKHVDEDRVVEVKQRI